MIKVGEYVRTENGEIHKVIEVKKDPQDWNYYKYENDMGDFEIYIAKHSKNIIDLIEVGDYVNGYEVDEFDDDEGNLHLGFPIYDDGLMDCIIEYRPLDTVEIKSIVTHEQFNSIKYEVI